MRIYIPAIYRTKKISGKEFFCKRLAKEFKNMGISLAESEFDKHDITLQSGLIRSREKAKVIFRADGVYNNINTKYYVLNNRIKKTINFSDGIVYQSKFSKIICEKYLGKFHGPSVIINNGFDTSYYDKIDAFNSKYKHNFLTASRWRPHKRLKEIIKCFRLANIEDSCLYVAGDISNSGISLKRIKKYISEIDNIVFLGQLEQKQLSSYIKMCDCFVHLCWQDSCPNGVVEAIAAGKPVITNNVGGTQEIVKPSGGIICQIDNKYDFAPCCLYEPPKFDYRIIADVMNFVVSKNFDIKNDHLDIKHIAKKYLDFFNIF